MQVTFALFDNTPQPNAPPPYQALTVSVGVNSSANHRVTLSADLTDANGNVVAHSNDTQELVVGANILDLRFSGADIYVSQENGPYKLTNLLLTDTQEAALVIAEAENVYRTARYQWRGFVEFTDDAPNRRESVTQISPNNANLRYLINFSGDEDWFRFHIDATANLQVHLTGLPMNYDVYLYNVEGVLLGRSTRGDKSAEEVFLANTPAGDYYVRVVGVNGAWDATNSYQL